jgi:hypothetical protein
MRWQRQYGIREADEKLHLFSMRCSQQNMENKQHVEPTICEPTWFPQGII